MTVEASQITAAQEFIRAAVARIAARSNEDVIRQNFTFYLRSMFPDSPTWLERHIHGGEAAIQVARDGQQRIRFIDNLVDLTTIEYESNLSDQTKYRAGERQVREHCAGLLRRGEDPEFIVGILSDTIHWYAFRIDRVDPVPLAQLEARHVHLGPIDSIDVSSGDATAARQLLEFLLRYLARLESRPLNAQSIRKDLGFDSQFCRQHLEPLHRLVGDAFAQHPGYARLIAELWQEFVEVAHGQDTPGDFSLNEYADELYLVTLSKLICANVIEETALLSDESQLLAILGGSYFRSKGLLNLVEYDYFGWLNASPLAASLLPIARSLQEDLRAYNFARLPSEDLFGQIMAQLARNSRRILLGQEWTPIWLASYIVDHTISLLPPGELPRFVDMCCGSGAMIVEAVRQAKPVLAASIGEPERVPALSQAITGFDIDPLAVMLAKINWVLAARDWLQPFGDHEIIIPVYHADSLFASRPLSSDLAGNKGVTSYDLQLADQRITMPSFSISNDFRAAFDELLDAGYRIAMAARSGPSFVLDRTATAEATRLALTNAALPATRDQSEAAHQFVADLATTINVLDRQGRNGIWAFILRNSYRPGLVEGQFNGLVSNPPWLALSKLADNPYQRMLKEKAEQFGIRPTGPAFLHVELATIFLLHAVDRYLKEGAAVGCIVPETILNGYHHHPFRTAAFARSQTPVAFALQEIWRAAPLTFKNNAVVLFGTKAAPQVDQPDPIPGAVVAESGLTPLQLHRQTHGRRTAWTEQALRADRAGFFSPADFRQGADIMPRTLFFHDVEPAPPARGMAQWRLKPINLATSPVAFVIREAKEFRHFRITPQIVPDDLVFDVLTSNLLTPFDLATPVQAVLPIRKVPGDGWVPLSDQALVAKSAGATATLQQIGQALNASSPTAAVWEKIDTRRKLSQQAIVPGKYLVVTGAGGANVCSAFRYADPQLASKLIIDQTLYWAQVNDEDAAVYLTGLLNSEAVTLVIQDFQPQGMFGRRHVHTLPFEVTPPFDPTLVAHRDVIERTRALLADLAHAKTTNAQLRRALNPNMGRLPQRRALVLSTLRQLASYPGYDLACRAFYGVT
jgi:methylase of polypeptide subunit release factors